MADGVTTDQPATQLHCDKALLATGEIEFAGQDAQTASVVPPCVEPNFPSEQATQPEFPVPDLYVPPKHCVHVPPSGPLDPALQMQAATAVLPAGEPEFNGHSVQTVLSK